jgi:phage tail sheath protein FI
VPEYLAPGVYVEETSFRSKSIEGVSTSTTGFAGPTRKGPVGETPELLTSFADFEQIYGGFDDLSFGGTTTVTNYIAHAVRVYFEEGGSRLYVARAFVATSGSDTGVAKSPNPTPATAPAVSFTALSPGNIGNGTITVTMVTTPVSLGTATTVGTVTKAPPGSVLRIFAPGSGTTAGTVSFSVSSVASNGGQTWTPALPTTPAAGTIFEIVTVNVTTTEGGATPSTVNYQGLGLSSAHPRYIGTVLTGQPTSRLDHLNRLFAVSVSSTAAATDVLNALLPGGTLPNGQTATAANAVPPNPPAQQVTPIWVFQLSGGDDGQEPTITAYDYDPAAGDPIPKGALTLLAGIEDIAIIAAPGSQSFSATNAAAVQHALINYAERRRAYRVAVLDTPSGQVVSQARAARAQIDSEYAALYYPWVVVANPLPGGAAELTLPPSGFLCGIYARVDDARGVFKAPANEVVQSALRFESDVNYAEQEVLNPLGVNCLRFFPDRGYRVWGARTVSTDPEWKYISVRRYFLYLEHSIDNGTQWAVFEPNGEKLWANIRQTISSFLYNEWVNGALLGSDPTQAFFVRCDRTTMTQNDLDNGRLVCLIGVAVVKPAEFVVFRIGQMTADSRS